MMSDDQIDSPCGGQDMPNETSIAMMSDMQIDLPCGGQEMPNEEFESNFNAMKRYANFRITDADAMRLFCLTLGEYKEVRHFIRGELLKATNWKADKDYEDLNKYKAPHRKYTVRRGEGVRAIFWVPTIAAFRLYYSHISEQLYRHATFKTNPDNAIVRVSFAASTRALVELVEKEMVAMCRSPTMRDRATWSKTIEKMPSPTRLKAKLEENLAAFVQSTIQIIDCTREQRTTYGIPVSHLTGRNIDTAPDHMPFSKLQTYLWNQHGAKDFKVFCAGYGRDDDRHDGIEIRTGAGLAAALEALFLKDISGASLKLWLESRPSNDASMDGAGDE